MIAKKMLILGAKETFLLRVIEKKTKEAGIDCEFVPWDVNTINSKIDGCSLITFYVDELERPQSDVLHFLHDKADEAGTRFIVVGERDEVNFINDNMPGELMYKSFLRPLDNDEYVKAITDFFNKYDSGEFRKSILIVDDDPNYMGLVRDWLKATYRVSMANSGTQALRWLGMNKADLILLDHEMPVTSGPKVLEMLRSDESTQSIPVIFLTGKGDKESVMEVVSLRPEGYFLKNIQKEELLEKLKDFFILHK